MLIKNYDEMLVNGSIGRVDRFVLPGDYGTERDPGFNNGVKTVDTSEKDPKKPPAMTAVGGVQYPVVHFSVDGGLREMLVTPDAFKVELPSGEVQASRTQVWESRTKEYHAPLNSALSSP